LRVPDSSRGERQVNVVAELIARGWRRFLDGLRPDDRRELVELLRDEYVDEARDAAQFEEHAQRMPYPHFRERLLRIAEEERAHVDWLREKIRELGGEVPAVTLTIKTGRNAWENLLMDVEEEKRDGIEALEHLYSMAARTDPEIAAGLRRMQEQERRHREEILNMLVRTDPQASPVVDPEQKQKK
jgi:rubrerythrin